MIYSHLILHLFLSLVVLITAIKQSEKLKKPVADDSLTADKDTESKN
jgi:hypothetical protein